MVRLHLPADRDQDRIQLAVMLMLRDIKHSKKWLCEFCGTSYTRGFTPRTPPTVRLMRIPGAPARETHTFNFFYRVLDSDLPRLVVYVRTPTSALLFTLEDVVLTVCTTPACRYSATLYATWTSDTSEKGSPRRTTS